MQYHKIKDESMYIYKGIAELEIGNLQGVKQVIKMSENESYRIMPGCVHRLTALEDCEVLECLPRIRRCCQVRRSDTEGYRFSVNRFYKLLLFFYYRSFC